jgi:hypothetical protein
MQAAPRDGKSLAVAAIFQAGQGPGSSGLPENVEYAGLLQSGHGRATSQGSGLVAGDVRKGRAQDLLVIHAHRGHDRKVRRDGAGGVKGAAQARFQHDQVEPSCSNIHKAMTVSSSK